MTTEVTTPATAFAPLPIRRRGTLEILDTALKLYRRYFWILIGWSAMASMSSLIPFFGFFSTLLLGPFIFASVACAVAAAVRGQKITFGQVWNFAKPRYGALVGVLIVAFIVFFVIAAGLMIVGALVFGGGAYLLAAAPDPLKIVGGVIGFILFLLLFSLLSVAAFGWLNMVPLIACLEDDKRGLNAMGRATDLMKGNWLRLFSLALLLGLAMLAVFAFVGGFLTMAFGGLSAFKDFGNDSATGFFLSISGASAVFYTLWYPAQALVMAVFYLDLRTRKEALDLEWANYATAPPVPTQPQFETPTAPYINPTLEPTDLAPSTMPSSFGAAPTQLSAETPSAVHQPDFIAVENAAPPAPIPEVVISESVPDPVAEANPLFAPEIPATVVAPEAQPSVFDEFGTEFNLTEPPAEITPPPTIVAPPVIEQAVVEPPITSSFTSSFAPSSFAPEPPKTEEEPGS